MGAMRERKQEEVLIFVTIINCMIMIFNYVSIAKVGCHFTNQESLGKSHRKMISTILEIDEDITAMVEIVFKHGIRTFLSYIGV